MGKYHVLGLAHRNYEQKQVSGHNLDFDHTTVLAESDILVLKDVVTGKRLGLEFTRQEGECGSGWTTASWAYMTQVDVTTWSVPIKRPVILDLNLDFSAEEISNEVFTYSYDGDDMYYPAGNYYINKDLFGESKRSLSRPLWVFQGDSNSGKSTLASETRRLVFDTDSGRDLKEVNGLVDVIVIGNKNPVTIEEIKKTFPDRDIVVVDFRKI